MDDNNNDIAIPQKLFAKLGLKFHIVNPYLEVDKDFEEIYFSNNEFASKKYFQIIYNYYKNYSDKVNLPGNFVASALEHFGHYHKNLNADILSCLNYVPCFKFVRDYYEEWLKSIQPYCEKFNIEPLIMFYWEERMANWGTQVHMDKDIAQEDIVPYNSRELIRYFLSVDSKYIDRPNYILARRMMDKLLPELLSVPYNPSFKNSSIFVFKKLKIWKSMMLLQLFLKSVKLKMDRNALL